MQHVFPSDVETPVRTALREALAELETKGWCQNNFYDAQGAQCMAGAIIVVTGCKASRDGAMEAIGRAIGGLIVPWNDVPGRTFAEVRAAFVGAIEATP